MVCRNSIWNDPAVVVWWQRCIDAVETKGMVRKPKAVFGMFWIIVVKFVVALQLMCTGFYDVLFCCCRV